MSTPVASSPFATADSLKENTRRIALVAVTTLFFMWGFITCLNDILIPHLKAVFSLSYVEASLIQFVFFGAYFIVSFPAGKLVALTGYQRGMVAGLLTCAIGCLLFLPAANFLSYPFFLGALFVLASGITILQVAANAYITVLGKPETASSRLNLAQAFNSLGTTVAPIFGGWLILAAVGSQVTKTGAEQATMVNGPYLGIAIVLALMAVGIGMMKLPTIAEAEGDETHAFSAVFKIRHLVLAAIAIFLYVGAEVSIGSYLINFLGDPQIAGMTAETAAHYVAIYWGAAMVGRFIGSALMLRIPANRMLAFYAACAVALLAIGSLTGGGIAMWAVLAIGFFNSIMFPTIFTLGIDGLGHLTSRGSSLIIMAIVGGAFIPVLMGWAADTVGIHHALFIPAVCYLYIIYYGMSGWRKRTEDGVH